MPSYYVTIVTAFELLRHLPRYARKPPATRAECPTARPCPHLTCKYNLITDLSGDGKSGNYRVRNLFRGGNNCALDQATRGGMTIVEVAAEMGITHQRVDAIETDALRKLEKKKATLR